MGPLLGIIDVEFWVNVVRAVILIVTPYVLMVMIRAITRVGKGN
jgi:hypothetical protein